MRRWSSMRRSPPGLPLPGRLAGPALFWTLAAVAALLALAAGGWLLRNGRLNSPPARTAAAPPLVALELDAPVQALAGEAFSVTVTASPPLSGTQILLAAQATGGLLALSLPLQDGVAVFSIPPGWSQSAGLATLRALGGGVTASRTVAIEPRTAANPLFTLTGPASVPVGSVDPPMLVAIPLDSLGNAVKEGAAVAVRWQPPAAANGSPPAEFMQASTRNLLAVVRLATHTAAGLLGASAGSQGAHSLTQSVRVMPADVEKIEVQAAPPRAPAASAAGVLLQTNLLADDYGNVLPDGVAVFFVAQSSDGSRRWLPATVVSGRAVVKLPAPLAASTLSVSALVGTAASPPITVTFTAPAPRAAFDLAVTQTEEAVTLRAGPLLTDLGALAPDGVAVTFTVTDPFGRRSTREAQTHFGFAESTLHTAGLPQGAFHVSAVVSAQGGEGQAGRGQAETTFHLPEAGAPVPEAGP